MGNLTKKRIAIIGAGPAGMFMLHRFAGSGETDFEIHIFERKNQLGAGMPYSAEGANIEHITNVSANEIPELESGVTDWLQGQPQSLLDKFGIEASHFSQYKVLPRLLFGNYLSAQFELILDKAAQAGIQTVLHTTTAVTDIADIPNSSKVMVKANNESLYFDHVIICTGHHWHKRNERHLPGYFDSPYPPSKLADLKNHPVALRGASLTAIDAIRTLARNNGRFEEHQGKLKYCLNDADKDFRIVLHSRNGLLPAVRFHLEDTHLRNNSLLTEKEISDHMMQNQGFLSLDFLFEKDFKDLFREKDPEFYETIKDMSMEQFVARSMQYRENRDPFDLLKAEYKEAAQSIKRHESIYWKEMLAVLSFAMNYPAKHFSAEDMLRLQKELKPLISIVIAFIPQSSCRELLALHDAGILDMVAVGNNSRVVPSSKGGIRYEWTTDNGILSAKYYQTYIDCVGQEPMDAGDFPFQSLLRDKTVNPAFIRFRDADAALSEMDKGNENVVHANGNYYYLQVPGIGIGDDFHVIDAFGANSKRIAIMSVPYIAGFNPDYSGLDFCEAASQRIIDAILSEY